MQTGSLVSSDAMTYTSRVMVDGVQREVNSWSVSREIQGDLPSEIGGGSGISQATASIDWAGDDLSDGSLNPWNPSTGWTPKPGQKIQIWCGDGVNEWLQFTGFIDEPSGEIRGGVSSSAIDNTDALSAVVNTPAMLATMPPLRDDDSDPNWVHRFPGLGAGFYVNLAAREAGYYSTPPSSGRMILDVPMQGSMMPLIGDLWTCSAQSSTVQPPLTGYTSWGDVIGDVDARFIPRAWSLGGPLQISLMIAPTHNGIGRARVMIGDDVVSLTAGTITVYAQLNGVTVASVPRGNAQNIAVLFDGDTAEVRTDAGQQATGTALIDLDAEITQVYLTGDATTRMAGLQVDRPTSAGYFRTIGWEPTYSFNFGTARVFTHKALPSVSNQPAQDLFSEIGESLLAPTWIDETGKLKTQSAIYMYSQPVVATLTTMDHITGMSWTHSLLNQRSKITGKYLLPVISQRKQYSVTVYEGTNEALENGDVHDLLISPDSGEDWVMVDQKGLIIGAPGWKAHEDRINFGQWSMYGATYTDGENDYYAINDEREKVVVNFRAIDHDTFTYSVTAQGIEPGYQVETRTINSPGDFISALWPQWWNKPLPVIRAKAKINWTDMVTEGTDTGAQGPAYEHEFGAWATGSGDRETSIMQGIIDHIAGLATQGFARINQLTVTPDPRLQVGDRVKIDSPNFLGVSIDAVIIGTDLSFSDSLTQTLNVRVLNVSDLYTTYAEFNQGADLTYEDWQAEGPNSLTYTGFNTTP